MAIILDDLGADAGAADAVLALHYPLTVSVLPNHPHSSEIAEEAHRRGFQVMLHLPMQSVGTPAASFGDEFLSSFAGVDGNAG